MSEPTQPLVAPKGEIPKPAPGVPGAPQGLEIISQGTEFSGVQILRVLGILWISVCMFSIRLDMETSGKIPKKDLALSLISLGPNTSSLHAFGWNSAPQSFSRAGVNCE